MGGPPEYFLDPAQPPAERGTLYQAEGTGDVRALEAALTGADRLGRQ